MQLYTKFFLANIFFENLSINIMQSIESVSFNSFYLL